MASRFYWVYIPPTDISDVLDLLQLVPVSGKPIRPVFLQLGQTSDFGAAQAENLLFNWIRGHTTVGSGVAAVAITPTPCQPDTEAASFTAIAFNSVVASAGTPVKGPSHCFNVESGCREQIPTPGFQARSTEGTLVLRLVDANVGTAPIDSLTIHGCVLIEEMGI